ncbi:hypothetical protein YC2023_049758 [Brassica napus]
MRDIILPSHGKKEYQVQVLMDGNLLKLEAKIQVEFTKPNLSPSFLHDKYKKSEKPNESEKALIS